MSETETHDLEGLADAWDVAEEAWSCSDELTEHAAMLNAMAAGDHLAAALRWAAAEIARQRARADAAEALLREAGGALEPFAALASTRPCEPLVDGGAVVVMSPCGRCIVTVHHFRAARALAAKIRERGDG